MTSIRTVLAIFVMSMIVGGECTAYAVTLPQLPQKQVNVAMPTVNGSTLNATCATLQARLNTAATLNVNLTHQIILPAGVTCTGPYILPSHTGGTGWILIKGSNYARLPPPGTRVKLTDATLMPHIKYGDDEVAHVGAFSTRTGAQRYRIMGIDMVQDSTRRPNWAMVVTGYGHQNALNTGYIILDRVVIRDTDARHETMRGVFGDAQRGHTALIDSYVAGIKDVGLNNDTQAWLSISNPGPILVQNNFLEASGENLMLGGGDPVNATVLPKDVTIRRNTFSKNKAWWGARDYLTKTLLELKLGVRVLIEGNDFIDMPWNDGGYAFRLTVRNQDGSAPYSEVSDLTIRHNLFKNITNGIIAFGADNQGPGYRSKRSKRWNIHNNLVYGLGGSLCGGGAACGTWIVIEEGGTSCTDPGPGSNCELSDLRIAHNTVDDINEYLFQVVRKNQTGLDFRDNLINVNGGQGLLNEALWGTKFLNAKYGSTWTFINNRLAAIGGGEETALYPQGTNRYPSSATSFLWTNRTGRNYTLQAGSPAKGAASDGTDQGVNFSLYNAARASRSLSTSALSDPAAPIPPQQLRVPASN
jgi:hypothetical protein